MKHLRRYLPAYQQLLLSCTLALGANTLADEIKASTSAISNQSCPELLNHTYKILHSKKEINLCELYQGKAMLLVNTASHCGYTKQFGGLETLHQTYKEQGLVVIGFASDDFKQEAKDEAEAAGICYGNYGVTFTMLAPTAVRGDDANPTFVELARLSDKPSWNFNKYLLSADGLSAQHFGSNTKPSSDKLQQAIEQALNAQH